MGKKAAKQIKVSASEISNLFEYLTSAPSIFIFGRRPKGSEPQPNFKLRSRLKLVRAENKKIKVIPSF